MLFGSVVSCLYVNMYIFNNVHMCTCVHVNLMF